MALTQGVLTDILSLQREPSKWFSVAEIQKHEPELLAVSYRKRDTGQTFVVPRESREIYKRLELWAIRLLEHEIRSYEVKIAEICSTNSVVTSPENDVFLVDSLKRHIEVSVQGIRSEIARFTEHTADEWARSWSKLNEAGKRLVSEMSATIPLAGEIARLELVESENQSIDRVDLSQPRVERFYESCFSRIPHPYDPDKWVDLSRSELSRAVRLLAYIVFHDVTEPRLSGFESKFVTAFPRYLVCPRDSSSSAVEQVAALFEPFLKKLAFIFGMTNPEGTPIWKAGLDGLVFGLNLTSNNLSRSDQSYWASQPVPDAVLRLAYQLRHKGAHEAHDYPYYERERNAYFVFAALLVSCDIVISTQPSVAKAIEYQDKVERMRDLFVKVDELMYGPDGPRATSKPSEVPDRLDKLMALSRRARAIWPICSPKLTDLLEAEYESVKYELTEADHESLIESYLEDMRPDY